MAEPAYNWGNLEMLTSSTDDLPPTARINSNDAAWPTEQRPKASLAEAIWKSR
jgi:hypothetical protein